MRHAEKLGENAGEANENQWEAQGAYAVRRGFLCCNAVLLKALGAG